MFVSWKWEQKCHADPDLHRWSWGLSVLVRLMCRLSHRRRLIIMQGCINTRWPPSRQPSFYPPDPAQRDKRRCTSKVPDPASAAASFGVAPGWREWRCTGIRIDHVRNLCRSNGMVEEEILSGDPSSRYDLKTNARMGHAHEGWRSRGTPYDSKFLV